MTTEGPIGRVWVLFRDTADGGALALRAWDELPGERAALAIATELGLPAPIPRVVPASIAEPLRAFSRGEPVDLASIPVELLGTPFSIAIYEALRRVPRGKVRTYAGLSADAGRPRAMRAVGQAMAKNPLPLVVPCHRVVGHANALGGYTGGTERKRILLGLEDVVIDGDTVVPGQLELLR